MKRTAFLLFLIAGCCLLAKAQYELLPEDSLKDWLHSRYIKPSAIRSSIALELLGRKVPGTPFFDSLRDVIIQEAENSRDRDLMCDAYRRTAHYYLNYSLNSDLTQKSKPYIDRTAEIANESGLDKYKIGAGLEYARYYRSTVQRDRALEQDNQAINLAAAMPADKGGLRDSLLYRAYSSLAFTWDLFANKLSRFQALLSAREFAEKSGIRNLIVGNDIDIADFYSDAEQYEKCKDYYALAIQKGTEWELWWQVIQAMRRMAVAFVSQPQKNTVLAFSWYSKALKIADSLSLPDYRVQLHLDLLNFYLNYETPEKGIAYMKGQPEIVRYINDLGAGYQLNKLYAAACGQRGKYDSALYFMQVAAPYEYGQAQNFGEKYSFTLQYTGILKELNRSEEIRNKLLLAKNFADSSSDLNMQEDVSKRLDSAYQTLGDYKNAFYYNNLSSRFKNTLDSLGKQKDLLNVEIADANRRAEQQKLEEESRLQRRDNLQYMGITAAIALLFIVLVVFGVFKMSAAVIRALGFFAFIFLFEFITLLLDRQIHEITHGEPWKVLGIKIVLIAMLLPLHHSLEHKVFHYLTSRAHKLKEKFRIFHHGPPGKATASAALHETGDEHA